MDRNISPKYFFKTIRGKRITTFCNSSQAGEDKAKLVIKEIKVPNKKDDKKINIMTLFKLNMKGCIEEKNELTK